MANGDDGYVDVGGGGSVRWNVKVNEGENFATKFEAAHKEMKPGHTTYTLSGRDTYGKEGQDPGYFEITVEQLPAKGLKVAIVGRKLRVYLPVKTQDEPQIKVRWGDVEVPSTVYTITVKQLDQLMKKMDV